MSMSKQYENSISITIDELKKTKVLYSTGAEIERVLRRAEAALKWSYCARRDDAERVAQQDGKHIDCCCCHVPLQWGRSEIAAWTGDGRYSCFKCFGNHGWSVFDVDGIQFEKENPCGW